ncbi:hypothetical protein RND81_10G195400 [Saponaria officinalis]|uniref:non-specific serine/threonine protein kinase n=1 Tax=Saponaria officinalis TaxID=3572 RepID=A0AAW1I3Q9_SAPOF
MYLALFFFLTIFSVSYSLGSSSAASTSLRQESQYEKCTSNSSRCGTSSVETAYPFWGNGHPQYCGHPRFELSCNGDYPSIKIKSRGYQVLNIDYNTSTLVIANEAFLQGECPEPMDLHNTTIDWTIFNYTSNVKNATLYYDCQQSELFNGAPFSFSCAGRYPRAQSFLVVTNDWKHQLDKVCHTKVYVSIYSNAVQELFDNSSSVGEVLKRGFEVKWIIDGKECQECSVSGGSCGYDTTSAKSICFCADGTVSANCHTSTPSRGLSLKAKVGIGLAAAAAAILATVTWFVYVRPSKDYESSTSFTKPKQNDLSAANPEEENAYFGTQLFSYHELQQATNYFQKSNEIGQGGFSTVYRGKLRDGRDVAIKRLYEKNKKQVDQFMNELEILTRLDHKHLVKLYGCTTRKSHELLFVYEYVPSGTVSDNLHGKLANPGSLSWPLRLRIAVETASALVYLHASDIIHRDVKTKNILLDENYSVKVADFGLSRLFPLNVSHVSTTPQGSPGYVDPEYHQCYQLTDKSDVYSFGVVLAELLSGKPAVDRNRSRRDINLSNLAINKIKNKAWSEFIDPSLGFESNAKVTEEVIIVAKLAFHCLQATKDTRPSMEEVFERLYCIRTADDIAEIPEVSRDIGVDLGSSTAAVQTDEPKKVQSTTLASVDNDSRISVFVNVSSDTP